MCSPKGPSPKARLKKHYRATVILCDTFINLTKADDYNSATLAPSKKAFI